MKRFLICLAAIALFTAIRAHAQSRPKPPEAPLGMDSTTMMDTDGDGKISLGEWTQFRAARFNETDTDGDGYRSSMELQKKPGPPL